MPTDNRFSLSPRVAASLVPAGGTVLVETDGRDPHGSELVLQAAARLAAAADAELVLYDRSTESFFLDPHPSGPWTADVDGPRGDRSLDAAEVELLGRTGLWEQLRRATAAGARARAWLGRGMGPGALAEAVHTTRARLVVHGRPRGSPSLLAAWSVGHPRLTGGRCTAPWWRSTMRVTLSWSR